MSLKNVHPEVAKAVLKSLPADTKLVSAMSVDTGHSAIVVQNAGINRSLPMTKVSLAQFFRNRPVDVQASEGEELSAVYQRLSDKYKLNLIPGIDYVAEGVVEFGPLARTTAELEILPDSITLSGSQSFFIRNASFALCPTDVIVPDLTKVRTILALASKVFTVKTAVSGDQVSSELSKQVVAYLEKALTLPEQLTLTQVGTAEVLYDGNDGITRLLLFKTLDGVMYPIRYAK